MAKSLVISRQADIPIPTEALKRLLPAQFSYLKGLRQSGKMECNYGYVGAKGGASIINAESHEELQRTTNGFPMFPFVNLEIHPLITLEEMEASAQEMLKHMPLQVRSSYDEGRRTENAADCLGRPEHVPCTETGRFLS